MARFSLFVCAALPMTPGATPQTTRVSLGAAVPALASPPGGREVTPEVWRMADGTYVSPNATALKAFLGHSANCDVYAEDADIHNMHKDSHLTQICKDQLCDHAGWHLNMDGYDTCVNDYPQDILWTGLDPDTGSRQVDSQDVHNPTNDPASIEIDLGGSTTSSNSASLTTTSQISESITMEIGIPEVMKVSTEASWLMSSTSTQEVSHSNEDHHDNKVTVEVPPQSTKCAKLQVDTVSYSSHFELPVCVSGYMRCQYGYQCHGHYYWYVWIDVCQSLKGRAGSVSNSHAHTEVSDGACPSTSASMLV